MTNWHRLWIWVVIFNCGIVFTLNMTRLVPPPESNYEAAWWKVLASLGFGVFAAFYYGRPEKKP